MTHSEKVGRTGRRCAEFLTFQLQQSNPSVASALQLDPTVILVAGYIHDLGHPPFGHIGEDELQRIVAEGDDKRFRLSDSFEGNAQTFRIITKLSIRKFGGDRQTGDGHGLNLCRATLLATLKYPWLRGRYADRGAVSLEWSEYYEKKWGAYDSESDELEFALEGLDPGLRRSLEAELMDWADDMTYAIHDVEDFHRLGVIPLHEIGRGLRGEPHEEFDAFWSYAVGSMAKKGHIKFDPVIARSVLSRWASFFPRTRYYGTDQDRVLLKEFASSAITAIQESLSIDGQGRLKVPDGTRMAVEVLKELTWYYVVEHPDVSDMQHGQRQIVRELHGWLIELVMDAYEGIEDSPAKWNQAVRKKRRISPRLVSLVDIAFTDRGSGGKLVTEDQRVCRAVTDFISSLTEEEATDMHSRLGGGTGVDRNPISARR